MIRGILGAFAGIAAGTGVILLIEMLGHSVYPVPPGVDLKDPASLKKFIENAPAPALFVVLAAYAAGSFVGGAIGTWVARKPWAGWAVGAVLLALGVVNLLMLPHPVWFWVASLSIYLPFAWLGSRLVQRGVRTTSST